VKIGYKLIDLRGWDSRILVARKNLEKRPEKAI
jgi:hypothetical protein